MGEEKKNQAGGEKRQVRKLGQQIRRPVSNQVANGIINGKKKSWGNFQSSANPPAPELMASRSSIPVTGHNFRALNLREA